MTPGACVGRTCAATRILKRLLIHAGGFNLGLVMRHLIGVGTPRALQGRLAAAMAIVVALWTLVEDMRITIAGQPVDPRDAFTPSHRFELLPVAS